MKLSTLDITIILLYILFILFIGLFFTRSSSKNTLNYFLSNKKMPWWLLGVSMVATTFSTDTPNLVTDIVRTKGIKGNWEWWAFLITGLLTVFLYSKLWRKSNLNTDLEFYELRYGGKPARFLRQFRAVYLGLIFNVLAMAGVTLAAIKIGETILGISAIETVIYGGLTALLLSTFGGFKGILYTDFILFFVALTGSVLAAWYSVSLPEVGGLQKLISNEKIQSYISIFPDFNDKEAVITLLIIPLSVQWWSSWYPGAEPGGGGYIAQRMLSAKNEKHAIGATLFFNIMHYAIRPWPWIIVALCSIIIYPDLESIKNEFSNVSTNKLKDDIAYSIMLTKLPIGVLGFVLASLVSAYMSTISTHLNWGASYLVNDFYKQTINKNTSEKKLVFIGKISTVMLMIISTIIALTFNNAKQLFNFILMFGAGTGAIYILRWFWWRINAWSEISAMVSSGIISIIFSISFFDKLLFNSDYAVFENYLKYPFVVLLTSIIWLTTTFLTPPEKDTVLIKFVKKIKPNSIGWKKFIKRTKNENKEKTNYKLLLIVVLASTISIYSILFFIGYIIMNKIFLTLLTLLILILSSYIVFRTYKNLLKKPNL